MDNQHLARALPLENLTADGWFWTSPVGHYPDKGYGLVDMAGNVWEWTSTPFPIAAGVKAPQIVKGGSFLCADNYCMRYLSSSFIAQTLDTATCHMGFRCAADALVWGPRQALASSCHGKAEG